MPTSINVGTVPWLDGPTYNALTLRTLLIAPLAYGSGSSSSVTVRSGVYPAGGTQALQVNASSGMNVTVNPGYAAVANSSSVTNGAYLPGLLTQGTLTVQTSDPTNPRIDLVVIQVTDNGDATSFGQVELVTGTPAPSPTAPAAPANSLTLAQISVAANATSIVAGNITDLRVWTVPPGGILPVASSSVAPTGQNGMYAHDLSTGRLLHNGGSGAKQPHLLPFQRAIAVKTTDTIANSATEVTVLTVNVTTDGSTDIEIIYKWFAIFDADNGTTSANIASHHNIYIDSTKVDVTAVSATSLYGSPSGGTGFYTTSSLLGTTPTAGTHTIKWTFNIFNTTDHIHLQAGTGTPTILVVRPVCL